MRGSKAGLQIRDSVILRTNRSSALIIFCLVEQIVFARKKHGQLTRWHPIMFRLLLIWRSETSRFHRGSSPTVREGVSEPGAVATGSGTQLELCIRSLPLAVL